jgi:hypothetical protein
MATPKLVELLKALSKGTAGKQIWWEDLPDEEMFRAHVAGGMVRIGKSDSADLRGYTLWLIGPGGVIAGEFEIRENDPNYPLIEDVYTSARMSARGGDQLVDAIIRQLS